MHEIAGREEPPGDRASDSGRSAGNQDDALARQKVNLKRISALRAGGFAPNLRNRNARRQSALVSWP